MRQHGRQPRGWWAHRLSGRRLGSGLQQPPRAAKVVRCSSPASRPLPSGLDVQPPRATDVDGRPAS